MKVLLAIAVVLALLPPRVQAHALQPAALVLRETGDAVYEVSFRHPPQLARALSPQFPADCRRSDARTTADADQQVAHFTLHCARSLAGRTLAVEGLVAVELSAIVSLATRDGVVARALLTPVESTITLPAQSTGWAVLGAFVRLGVTHLATGLDHVLFIVGLCALVRGLRRQLWTLTAFTLGHSLTLCAAALSWLRVPERPVEVAIALSLVLVAHAVLRGERAQARPWRMALAFGLLHGFGFAGALAATGLPEHARALSLAGFNLGVELGQVIVVLAFAPLAYLARRAAPRSQRAFRIATAYATGGLAAMWCIERAIA